MGSVTTLLDPDARIDAEVRRDLLIGIHDEADRLNRLLHNLLAMTRIEGGGLEVRREWQVPEETIGAAIQHLGERARGRSIKVTVAEDIELVAFDGLLVELALINLLDNAIKYTPADTTIELRAARQQDALRVELLDRGPGVDASERARVFEKFYRGREAEQSTGAGLGLAICKAVVEAHGGALWVTARSDGPGAIFGFTLPIGDAAPPADIEREPAAEVA